MSSLNNMKPLLRCALLLAATALLTAILSTGAAAADGPGFPNIATAALTLTRTIALARDPGPDTSSSGRGVPNYLAGIAISPEGKSVWVSSKKDNVGRGRFLEGTVLDFENTVRAIVSRIDVAPGVEVLADRIDLDNTDSPTGIVFSPLGDYFFVALQGNNAVQIRDALAGGGGGRHPTRLAPQGVRIDQQRGRLFTLNFIGRTVTAHDLGAFLARGAAPQSLGSVRCISTEAMPASVLLGKQIFYNAADPRMSLESYVSCASCHVDGGQDGRVWDFTDRGEGQRNASDLRGRSGSGHGFVHWSANFDEIQDFEHDIRRSFGGTGFMSNAAHETGTRNTPLGDTKAGISPDFDALADFLTSLSTADRPQCQQAPHSARTSVPRASSQSKRRTIARLPSRRVMRGWNAPM